MNTNKKEDTHLFSRRSALKTLVATGGATALSMLPTHWEKPFVEVGALPAIAQTSPGQYPFTNEIESIEFDGADSSLFQTATLPGWLVVAEAGTTINATNHTNTTASRYPWILGYPWLKVKRRWGVVTYPWANIGFITLKITIKFRHRSRFLDTDVPIDDTDLWSFVLSGAGLTGSVYDDLSYYVVKAKIKKKK